MTDDGGGKRIEEGGGGRREDEGRRGGRDGRRRGGEGRSLISNKNCIVLKCKITDDIQLKPHPQSREG